ncbi:hypothetical protein ACX80U_17150 [Arthrobacter sp. TmT3-37]
MTINMQDIEAQARKMLNSRVTSVTELVETRQRVTDLQAQLADAEREDKKAYVRATKDGWTEDELKKLGLDNAASNRRRSSRKTASTNDNPAQSAPTES